MSEINKLQRATVEEQVQEQKQKASDHDKYHPHPDGGPPWYGHHGPVARIVRWPVFENFTLFIIFVNACWIGYDCDYNRGETLPTSKLEFKIMENFFCFYFTGEVVIRYFGFHTKSMCLRDGWFVFDSALVTMMVFETWIVGVVFEFGGGGGPLRILRLLRLLRLTRMARLMRSVPEILVLVRGMAAATRSVLSTLVLLIVLLYVFAILMTSMLGKTWPKAFEADIQGGYNNMPMTIFSLMMRGTLLDDCTNMLMPLVTGEYQSEMCLPSDGDGDCEAATDALLKADFETDAQKIAFCAELGCYHTGGVSDFAGYIWLLVWLLFMLLASFTVLNMLIGVLCEVVSATAILEKEKALICEVQEAIESVFEQIDSDGTGMISKEEFMEMIHIPEVVQALESIDIEPAHLLPLADSLFEVDEGEKELSVDGTEKDVDVVRGRELTFEDFIETVVGLRPEKDASVLDAAEMRKSIRQAFRKIEGLVDDLTLAVQSVLGKARGATPLLAVRPGEGAADDPFDAAFHQLISASRSLRETALAEASRADVATARAALAEQRVLELEQQLGPEDLPPEDA